MTSHLSPDDILIIVPARGGSKGIPRKNLAPFRGEPLIRHTLDAVRQLPDFCNVLVSTEDAEIRDYCESQGLSSGYHRPHELAGDDSPIADVLIHGYEWMRDSCGRDFRYIMMLQATSPLRTPGHIREFTDRLFAQPAKSLISVSPMTEHPMECLSVRSPNQPWEYLVDPPADSCGRQSYVGEYYYINGAMYVAEPEFLREKHSFLVPGVTELFVMPREFSLDVDNPEDLLR